MNALAELGLVSLVALGAAGATYLIAGPPARTFQCDPALLKPDELCLESVPDSPDIVWVDARSRADWKKNGLGGSLLWNLDPSEDMQAFEAAAAEKIAISPQVVVYCGDENCGVSRQVAARIRALDLGAEVRVLHGGWRALKDAGRVKDSNPEP